MVRFSALVPDATVNYIENPNCRYATTGYNAFGSTLTRSLDYARFGIASCKVVTNGTVLREGVYYRVNTLQAISGPLTASAYVTGTGVVRLRLIDNPTGKEWTSETVTLRADRWTRISATGTITGSNDVRLYVETNEGSAMARTFYVGGLQMERKAYVTTFCDGDQPECRWNGVYHASSSQRAGDTRAGGRWVQIAGEEREEQNLYMTVVGGLGMAALTNNLQSFALEAGASFQNRKVQTRNISLSFHAKHVVAPNSEEPVSLAALHQLRQLLIDIVKPDRTGGDEDIWFEYDDGNAPLYFQARYDGGLEGEWDIRNQWVNSFPLKLLAVNPVMIEDDQRVSQIDFQGSLVFNYALGRINGVWSNLNYGMDGRISTAAIGPDGKVYMAGLFTLANNSASALSPLTPARVVYWDGTRWNAIAATLAGGSTFINDIAVMPNGDVVVTGDFTTIDGVAATRIARWNGSAWSAFGAGLNGAGRVLAVAYNGDIYVGGDFTTAGGVNCAKIARWDGFQFRPLGQYGGLNDPVFAIAISQDGSILYAGGQFTDQNGLAASALLTVAQYDTSTGLFSAMGNGFAGGSGTTVVNDILITHDNGRVYAAGDFTLSGSETINNIAEWNGNTWLPMGDGLDRSGERLDYFSDGTVIAAGQFNNTGSTPVSKLALWNGSTWSLYDAFVNVGVGHLIDACVVDRRTDDLFIGFGSSIGTSVQVYFSGMNTINNPGSMEVLPRFYIRGPGTLRWLENQTNHKRMYLNIAALNGEDIFIDIARGVIESTVRGNLLYTLLPGSNFRTFSLMPGDNALAVFMFQDVAATMQIAFTPRHWSVDATQNVESL